MTTEGITIFEAQTPGPTVMIMGGVHGNEPCGVHAVKKLTAELESSALKIACGQLVLVVANALALEKGVRAVEANLNRLFLDSPPSGTSYEHKRAEELKPFIQQADFLLDLHATRSETPPFLMAEEHQLEDALEFAMEHLVVGFGALGSEALQGDTETYGHRYGAKAFTMECGQQSSEESSEVAYEMSLRFLKYTGIIPELECPAMHTKVHTLQRVYEKKDNSFVFHEKFANFTSLKQKQIIARESECDILAPDDCTLVILCDDASKKAVGEELFFLAQSLEVF